MKLTNNQKAMREICDELQVDFRNIYYDEATGYADVTGYSNGKYLSITLFQGELSVDKLNEVCDDKIIQAVKNSSFIGGLVVPTTYKIN